MNLERAFLHAVAEDFDDDTTRLVFADWLEDNGDPLRAEFIRNECEWARTGHVPDRREWVSPEMGSQEAAWLREGKAAWNRVLPALQGGWTFTRGIPEGVSYGPSDSGDMRTLASFSQDVPFFFSIPTIREMSLNCGITQKYSADWNSDWEETWGVITEAQCQEVVRLPEMKQVQTLRLHRAYLELTSWQMLLNSPHLAGLTTLELVGCPLSPEVVTALVVAPLAWRLKGLRIGGDSFCEYQHQGGYGGGFCTVRASIALDSVQILSKAPSLAGLRVLDISGNNLGQPAIESLCQSRHLSPELQLVLRAITESVGILEDRCLQELRDRFRKVAEEL